MKLSSKIFLFLLTLLCLPALAYAADASTSALSFRPPATDVSVALLSTIFGVVDGVLYGGGSQIMGQMFKIFNGAVLVLGGIIIIYTLFVSTLRTAHEGEMMGQKWSSIWIPVRSAAGIALLLPKASGYCLIQIIFMWLVVQGVGAADKVWGAALDYLKAGGTIISASNTQDQNSGGNSAVFNDRVTKAGNVLKATVCMDALQELLQKRRTTNSQIQGYDFTDLGPAPNFLTSVDAVNIQNNTPENQTTVTANFPDIVSGNQYARFNGVCGSMSWQRFSNEEKTTLQDTMNISGGLLDQVMQARVLAVQQVYLMMASMGQRIANNELNTTEENKLPFGEPGTHGQAGVWVSPTNKPALLEGTELTDAVTAYFAILQPTLRSIEGDLTQSVEATFVDTAKSEGWILAGSYFFKLAQLSQTNQRLTEEGTDKFTVAAPNQIATSQPITHALSSGQNQLSQEDVAQLVSLVTGNGAPSTRNLSTYITQATEFARARVGPTETFQFGDLSFDPQIPETNWSCTAPGGDGFLGWSPGKFFCDTVLPKWISDTIMNKLLIKGILNPAISKFFEVFGRTTVGQIFFELSGLSLGVNYDE